MIPAVNPALLPLFPGAHAVRDALAAGAAETGVTVHVIDTGVDTGPVIAQESLVVLPGESEAALHERIKASGLPASPPRFAFTPHVTVSFYPELPRERMRALLAERVAEPAE